MVHSHVLTHDIIAGWWLSHPSEKYESQWEGLSHIFWNIMEHKK